MVKVDNLVKKYGDFCLNISMIPLRLKFGSEKRILTCGQLPPVQEALMKGHFPSVYAPQGLPAVRFIRTASAGMFW